jgi:hypothetical protein
MKLFIMQFSAAVSYFFLRMSNDCPRHPFATHHHSALFLPCILVSMLLVARKKKDSNSEW